MRQSELKVILGPGGLIRDNAPQNEELLKQIARTPALPAADLLKLAEFYQAYPTNAPLGNHLALLALAKLLSNRDIQEELQKAVTKTAVAAVQHLVKPFDWSDIPEDIADFASDEGRSGEPSPFAQLEVQWVPYSGVGLLIETPRPKHGQHKKHHYVIGVSPDPDSL
ncbi:MAG: hypothetical protein NVS4B11_20900 [Ktedonobacteraceae bacterium]